MSKNTKLIVKQVKSAIGRQGNQRKTLIGLGLNKICLLYTSPSPRDKRQSRMPSSA